MYAKVAGAWKKVYPPEPPPAPQFNDATGGTVSEYTTADGKLMRVHTFTASGDLTVKKTGQPWRVLVVAGGGGGGGAGGGSDRNGMWYGGGGGGAGGMVESAALALPAGAHAIAVGTGGALFANGGDSSIGSLLSATGGGRAGSAGGGQYYGGAAGGSGGGGAFLENNQTMGPGAGTPGQGNSGGSCAPTGEYYRTMAGGGGGAGGAGGPNAVGPGKASDISGASVTYAEGGGPGGPSATIGGGGGSPGYRAAPENVNGSPGKDGIVVVSYKIG
jgi:hypothetical protein